jgi:Protein of unknown function DUF86
MQPDPRTYLWDALQAADSISRFVQDRTYDDYDTDELLRSGVERKFEIIGEALNQLSKADRDLASRIPDLRQIIGLRPRGQLPGVAVRRRAPPLGHGSPGTPRRAGRRQRAVIPGEHAQLALVTRYTS